MYLLRLFCIKIMFRSYSENVLSNNHLHLNRTLMTNERGLIPIGTRPRSSLHCMIFYFVWQYSRYKPSTILSAKLMLGT